MLKQLLIGHLGKDAIVNNVNEKTVINFNVAHSDSYKDHQGNKITHTTWVSCAWWTDRTAIVPYLKKGVQVYVEGFPSVEMYTNNSGQPVAQLKMRVDKLQLLGSASDSAGGGQSPQAQPASTSTSSPSTNDIADDLPF